MLLQQIERIKTISAKDFYHNYYKKQIPVVIEELAHDWSAYQKWSLSYIREIAGQKVVPLYDDRPVSHKDKFNEAHRTMKMSEYIDLLESEPTPYRIFLYNLLKEVPVLQNDFKWPNLGVRFVKQMPMLFFGGKNSKVFMHFDIDYSNIFHFHFHGEKQCILFHPDQTNYLYKIPHSLISREDIDFDKPDYQKFPALKQAKGLITTIKHGQMIYMPEGYWHYMKYITAGFSMSLRSLPHQPKFLFKAIYNIFIMRHFDNFMRKRKGESWINQKNEKAISKTHKRLGIE